MFELDTIVCGDCLDVMADMPDGCVDLVVTDPPYGIGISLIKSFGVGKKSKVNLYPVSDWDKAGLSALQFAEIKRVGREQIIFGFNYLSDILPPASCVIVWDKKLKNDWDCNFADCEIAWTSLRGPSRVFRHLWMGACRQSETGKGEGKVHPTQKPIALMEWIIRKYTDVGDITFDPFVGSGTTAIAALKSNRRFYGCDISPEYIEIANKRIEKARLEMVQMSMDLTK